MSQDANEAELCPIHLSAKAMVKALFVKSGDRVEESQKLAEIIYDADSEEDTVFSNKNGIIVDVCDVGSVIDTDVPIAIVQVDLIVSPRKGTISMKPQSQSKFEHAHIIAAIDVLLRKRRDMETSMVGDKKNVFSNILDEIDDQICKQRIKLLNIYKLLMQKEQRRFNSGYLPFNLSTLIADRITKKIPAWPISESVRQKQQHSATIQSDVEDLIEFEDTFAGRSTSTYPYMSKKGGRDGDPICDFFKVVLSPTDSIITVCDGCNWGTGPADAARRASKGFIDFLTKERPRIFDTHRLTKILLSALCAAHNAIIEGDDPDRNIGTTTLLGGMLCKVDSFREIPRISRSTHNTEPIMLSTSSSVEEEDDDSDKWVFVFVSIGDCKAFLWDCASHEVLELTPNSRNENASDASDCGGRLGPYVEGGPDLRNLGVFATRCNVGDIILVCSDGVHDNFDPQMWGKHPTEFNLEGDSWTKCDPDIVNEVKSKFRQEELSKLVSESSTVGPITDTIVKHCIKYTEPSRNFMQENLGKKLPSDYVRFPGKMDHTTLIALKVDEIDPTCIRTYCRSKQLTISKDKVEAKNGDEDDEGETEEENSTTEKLNEKLESIEGTEEETDDEEGDSCKKVMSFEFDSSIPREQTSDTINIGGSRQKALTKSVEIVDSPDCLQKRKNFSNKEYSSSYSILETKRKTKVGKVHRSKSQEFFFLKKKGAKSTTKTLQIVDQLAAEIKTFSIVNFENEAALTGKIHLINTIISELQPIIDEFTYKKLQQSITKLFSSVTKQQEGAEVSEEDVDVNVVLEFIDTFRTHIKRKRKK